jgi:tRNA threonylcarbamoyladenosine biosynthesis protein TsaB
VSGRSPVALVAKADIDGYAAAMSGRIAGPAAGRVAPAASACAALFAEIEARGPVDLDRWEPSYGRLAEAQVKWEAAHGRPLSA